ncbi:MAG: copper resistance protein CopC [Chloroflexi bacterium]|nr:copper resistance protein CopC [Chloroflexota bacterium]
MRRRWAAGFLAAGVWCATALPALAHANLVRSDPAANANLDQAPARVELWFSEKPELKLSDVEVFNAQRGRVDSGPLAAAPDDSLAATIALQPNLPQGVYTVSWKTTSAVDGHVTGGALAFGIGVAPSPADLSATALAAQPAGPSPISVIFRWLSYVAAVGLLGLVLFDVFVVDAAAPMAGPHFAFMRHRLVLTAQVLGGLLFLTAIDLLLDQAARAAGGIGMDALQATATTTVGTDLLIRIVLAAAIAAFVILRPTWALPAARSPHRSLGAAAAAALPTQRARLEPSRAVLLALLLAFLFLFALTSHAQAVPDSPDLALFVDWLHLTTAGIWVGGLIAMSIAVVPALGSRVRPRASVSANDPAQNAAFGPLVASFSHVALISAVGLAVTGFYQALVHVGSVDNALTTGFGVTLVVKTAIFGLALLLAGFHRWFLLPALDQPGRAPATRARRFLSRTLPLEALLAVGVLAATGLLTSLSPANTQAASGIQTRNLGDTRVTFQVAPLQVGANLFQVTLQSQGQPVTNADLVELRLTMLDMDMGQSVLDLQPKGQGVYAAEGDLLSMSGRWRIDLLVRLPGQFDKTTSFGELVPT